MCIHIYIYISDLSHAVNATWLSASLAIDSGGHVNRQAVL